MATAAPAADPVAPCTGFVKEDPAGDNTTYLLGNDTGFPSQANGDLLGLFVNRTSATTTLYLKVAEVNKNVPPGSTSLGYRVFYTQGGQSMYLEAGLDAGDTEPYFEYGTFETGFVKLGDVKGTWAEGPNGVIGWEIPPDGGGKAGVRFTEMYGWPGYLRGGIYTPTDYIPDGGEDGSRIAYNGASCPEGGKPPAGGGTPPPPTPPGSPPPSQPTNPNPGAPAAATGPLQVTVKPSRIKARKVKKARKLSLRAEAREQLTNVVFTLKKGKKSMGSGKLAKLTNKAKLSLKLKKKGLKKGTYSLVVTAKRANGTTGTVTLKFRVA